MRSMTDCQRPVHRVRCCHHPASSGRCGVAREAESIEQLTRSRSAALVHSATASASHFPTQCRAGDGERTRTRLSRAQRDTRRRTCLLCDAADAVEFGEHRPGQTNARPAPLERWRRPADSPAPRFHRGPPGTVSAPSSAGAAFRAARSLRSPPSPLLRARLTCRTVQRRASPPPRRRRRDRFNDAHCVDRVDGRQAAACGGTVLRVCLRYQAPTR